ncbi:Neurotrimin [Labeo rohita]|uniref:Neurotrimin n=1 Tax=Labeo rohita TaxID=84645 RepID=A0ABQ8MB11_LABRO|nr:Neurotrimin [Labeo rohita]
MLLFGTAWQTQKFGARNHVSHSTPGADEVLSVLLRTAREGSSQNKGTNPHTYRLDTYWDLMNSAVRKMEGAACNVDNKVSRVAWLNRTTILFTGNEKWSLDPRVVLLNTAVTEYSIKILNVNLYDEGPYVCSILTNKKPESTKVHLIVQVQLEVCVSVNGLIVFRAIDRMHRSDAMREETCDALASSAIRNLRFSSELLL